MTKFKAMTLMAATAIALPAFAMAQTMADIDANGDGVLTMDEVQAVFSDVSTDGFSAMDLNADGILDADEVAALASRLGARLTKAELDGAMLEV